MALLTAQDIETAWVTRTERTYGRITLPGIGENLRFSHWPEEGPSPLVSDQVIAGLGALCDAFSIDVLTPLLAEHCRSSSRDISYGYAQPGEDETLANYRAFGLNADGTPPDGWYSNTWLHHIALTSDPQKAEHRDTAHLRYLPPWEDEHGVNYRVADGTFVEFNY